MQRIFISLLDGDDDPMDSKLRHHLCHLLATQSGHLAYTFLPLRRLLIKDPGIGVARGGVDHWQRNGPSLALGFASCCWRQSWQLSYLLHVPDLGAMTFCRHLQPSSKRP